MDRTFSTSNNTGGALRQYHQQQPQPYQQNVRNSPVSPSNLQHQHFHQQQQHLQQQQYQQQTSQYCRISSSSGTSPTQNNLNVSTNNGGSAGYGSIGIGSQVGFGNSSKDFNVAGNIVDVSLQAAAGTFLGVPNFPVQVQQYYHQPQQQNQQRNCPSFVTGSANSIRSGHSPVADPSFSQQHQCPQPLRSNNSRNISGNSSVHIQQNQQHHLQDSSNRGTVKTQQIQQTHNPNPYLNYSKSNLSAPPSVPVTVEAGNYYRRNEPNFKGKQSLAQKESYQQQQQYPPQQSRHSHHVSPSIPPTLDLQVLCPPPPIPQSHRHNNLHHPSSLSSQMPNTSQTNNMNKNRYGPSATTPVTSSHHQSGENINIPTSKQQLIQQITQTQQHQQQQIEMNNDATAVNAASNCQLQSQSQQQGSPQYRIFKRGDSIPGISSPPIQITTTISTTNSGISSLIGNDKSNCNLNAGITAERRTENADNDINTNNGGSDKENNVAGSGGGKENGGGLGGISSASFSGSRTPLSLIGEIAKFHSLSIAYRLIKETGPPHAPTFTVVLQLGNEEYSGDGPSIKKAQHAAAIEALEKTTLTKPPPKSKSKKPYSMNGGTGGTSKRPNWALIQLSNLAQELQLQLQFVQQPVPIADPFRRGDPPSIVAVHVGDNVFTGEGVNFNAAKNMAVMVALKGMMKIKQEADLAKLSQVDSEQNADLENKSPISIVHEMAMKRGLTVSFSIVQESGPPHMKVFTVNCRVGEEMETEGQGPTKQAAKKASSELMIAKLKEIPITIPATSQGVNLKAMQRGLLRQKTQKKKSSTPVVKDLEKQTVSPISRLIQIAHIKKYKEPEFVLISTGTESNVETFIKQITERDRRMLRKKKPIFTIQVTVGPHTCQGTGPNKKAAKKAAAEAAIIALGYEPTEDPSSNAEDGIDSGQSAEQSGSNGSEVNGSSKQGGKGKNQEKTGSPTVKLAGAKQIAPGIIVLKSEVAPGAATSAAAAQEMKKVGGMMMSSCPAASNREGIDKLAYLSNLLEISVSYSDFPKKNEYLSVVSLTTNPPHVAHGCGATLEEAQNAAALKILEELSTKGLDSVTAAAEKPSDS